MDSRIIKILSSYIKFNSKIKFEKCMMPFSRMNRIHEHSLYDYKNN